MRKSAFSPRALGRLFSKQAKIICHIVIKSSWGQTRQLKENWVKIELVEVCIGIRCCGENVIFITTLISRHPCPSFPFQELEPLLDSESVHYE